jgi:hypothetical protein
MIAELMILGCSIYCAFLGLAAGFWLLAWLFYTERCTWVASFFGFWMWVCFYVQSIVWAVAIAKWLWIAV